MTGHSARAKNLTADGSALRVEPVIDDSLDSRGQLLVVPASGHKVTADDVRASAMPTKPEPDATPPDVLVDTSVAAAELVASFNVGEIAGGAALGRQLRTTTTLSRER